MFREQEDQPGHEHHHLKQVHVRPLEQQGHSLPFRDQRAVAPVCPTDLKSIPGHSQGAPNLHLSQRVPEQHCLMKEHENQELDQIVMAEEK
tara:strand:+ start:64 stop:336 length:273 start_codon:yes stop_codon:yes gene_type:complete